MSYPNVVAIAVRERILLSPIYENIPDELKQYHQWVNWREEPRRDDPTKMTKPPYHPNGKKAESNNPLTWSHFITAKAAALTGRAVSTLRNERFLRRGLPYFKIGRRSVRYKLTDIITFMEARRITFDQDGGVGHD